MKKSVCMILIIIVIIITAMGCGTKNTIKSQTETDKRIEETQKQIEGDQIQSGLLTSENKSIVETTSDEAADQDVNENVGQKMGKQDFPYGIEKMTPIIEGFGNIIAVKRIDNKDYSYDVSKDHWSVIGASLAPYFDQDFGKGSYRPDESSQYWDAMIKIPGDDLKEVLSVVIPEFNGEIDPANSRGIGLRYDEDSDTYYMSYGEPGTDSPTFYGFREVGNGKYEALCGMENENEDYPNHRYDYGLLTLEHNKYEESVDDPMFDYTVTEVKCISTDEYDKIASEFSRDDLLPVAETYARFVTDNCLLENSNDNPGNGLGYGTAFVDNDEIPELITARSNDHMATIKIYAYRDGKVQELGEIGSLGEGKYVPYKNALEHRYASSGWEEMSFYEISGDELKKYAHMESAPEDLTQYDPENLLYYVSNSDFSDTMEVSKEGYFEALRKARRGNLSSYVTFSYDRSYMACDDYEENLRGMKRMLHIISED